MGMQWPPMPGPAGRGEKERVNRDIHTWMDGWMQRSAKHSSWPEQPLARPDRPGENRWKPNGLLSAASSTSWMSTPALECSSCPRPPLHWKKSLSSFTRAMFTFLDEARQSVVQPIDRSVAQPAGPPPIYVLHQLGRLCHSRAPDLHD